MDNKIIKLSSFLTQLNNHISQISNIITEMNILINEINLKNNSTPKLNSQIKQMNNLMNSMSTMPLNNESELKKKFNTLYNLNYFDKNNLYKKNIIFKTIQGFSDVITVDYFTSIGDLLKLYLKRTKKSELCNREKVNFIFNSKTLRFDDKRKVEELFKDGNNHTIIVTDCKNRILSTPHYKNYTKNK